MFYPFIVFALAIAGEPQHGRAVFESPIGYPTLNRCIAQLSAIAEDTTTDNGGPEQVRITYIGCVFNPTRPV